MHLAIEGRFTHPGDAGTFTMSGAVSDAGTFVRVCVACSGDTARLRGTFMGKKGTYEVVDRIRGGPADDRWRIIFGSGAYEGLRGSGICVGKIVVNEVSFRGTCEGVVSVSGADREQDRAARSRSTSTASGSRVALTPRNRTAFRVGFVTDTGAPTDRGIGQLLYAGFVRSVKKLGLEGRVLVVPVNRTDEAALADLARQKYDLIVAGLFVRSVDTTSAARQFPASEFLEADARGDDPTHPRNVQAYVFRVEESAYLAGYLAALTEEQRPGEDVISAVGGFPVPTVDRYIAGFRAGARKADPGITVLVDYSLDFASSAKCRQVALGQIARGSGAVFDVAGECGLGALGAAKEKGVWGIGVDVDQSSLGPFILTSVVKREDVRLFRQLQALVNGTFRTGGTAFVGLREDAVGLGRVSPKVPKSILRRVAAIRAEIVSGKIKVPATLAG